MNTETVETRIDDLLQRVKQEFDSLPRGKEHAALYFRQRLAAIGLPGGYRPRSVPGSDQHA